MARLGGRTITIASALDGWHIETGEEVVMDGTTAHHAKELIPAMAGYSDALAIRAPATYSNLAATDNSTVVSISLGSGASSTGTCAFGWPTGPSTTPRRIPPLALSCFPGKGRPLKTGSGPFAAVETRRQGAIRATWGRMGITD